MRKVKNFSKVIGLVQQGGYYSPSNPESERRFNAVVLINTCRMVSRITAQDMEMFRGWATTAGFDVVTIRRGLGR
jgi:hypothetical protein